MIRSRLLVAVLGFGCLAAQAPSAQEQAPDESQQEQQESSGTVMTTPVRLAPTAHPALPAQVSQYWFAPDRAVAALAQQPARANFARAVRLIADGQYNAALPLLNTSQLAATPLAAYAQYYSGVALAALNRFPEADAALTAAAGLRPDGVLREVLPLRQADVALARGDAKRAEDLLEDLSDEKLSRPKQVYIAYARAAERAGDRDEALRQYRRVYYEFPTSTEANDAQDGIARLETADLISPDRFTRELARAEVLFAAKRWAQAQAGFRGIARAAQGDAAELIALRIGECDYYLDRFRQAREAMRPYLSRAAREAEARFFYLTATRSIGEFDTYVNLATAFIRDFPKNAWTEEVLNNLASHYIIVDQDDDADAVFRRLYAEFPKSRYAERAAWKIGWRLYRTDDFRGAADVFEQAAAAYPRADNRPAWIYWSGRARDQFGDRPTANARYRLVVADYGGSYYGRLASRLLTSRGEPTSLQAVANTTNTAAPALPTLIPTESVIRELNALGLYDDALREVQYAQRIWGDSAQLQATSAWIRHNQGLSLTSTERFNAIRGAINTMRRAYPQFMTSDGEKLPPEILRIIFPLDYWPLIKKYSSAYALDPYLMAALMAQESTFTAEIKSPANAVGLMQLIPSTARQYARVLKMRYSPSLLTKPEANVRMGMRYFSDLVKKLGGEYFALASYNGGKVEQWRAEKPDLPQDEFIDDIPYPETQTYVKRILGTAEDYRRLYGGGLLDPNQPLALPTAASKPAASRTVTPAKKPAAKPATTKKAAPPKKKAPVRTASRTRRTGAK